MMPGGWYEYDNVKKILNVYPSDAFYLTLNGDDGRDPNVSRCETIIVHEGVERLFERQFEQANNCKELILPKTLTKIDERCFISSPIECLELRKEVDVGYMAFASTKMIKWDKFFISDVLRVINNWEDVVIWQPNPKTSIRLVRSISVGVFAGTSTIQEYALNLERLIDGLHDFGKKRVDLAWKYMQMYLDTMNLDLEYIDCERRPPKRLAKHLLYHPEGISDKDYMGIVKIAGFTPDVLEAINKAGKPKIAAWFMEQCKAGDKPKSDFDL